MSLRSVVAIESKTVELELEGRQALALADLGRRLTSSRALWGGIKEPGSTSVIAIAPKSSGRYAVVFRDVVGAVALDGLHIQVVPKIPGNHFSYLLHRSAVSPRLVNDSAHVHADQNFVELLARWCVDAAESLLKRGLRVDYAEEIAELQQVRGSIQALPTSLAIQAGRVAAVCEFEELSEDNAINRVVKAACAAVARRMEFDASLRRRARLVCDRMGAVGTLLERDGQIQITRLTRTYARVLPLARLVLEGAGVSSQLGSVQGSAFLIRTPELIESGVRNCLDERLGGLSVRKGRMPLGTSGLTINPDLVFGENIAIGDVKYRLLQADWDRGSLYQGVAFATGYKSSRAGVFGFLSGQNYRLPSPVRVGAVEAACFGWIASEQSSPAASADLLAREVHAWLRPRPA